jgi:hypothetical protein
LLLASIAAVTGLTVVAPSAAIADPTSAAATATSASTSDPPRCRPAHWGRDWLWHDGHWDHWEWNRWSNGGEWKHYWRDDRYCDGDRGSEGSPVRESS